MQRVDKTAAGCFRTCDSGVLVLSSCPPELSDDENKQVSNSSLDRLVQVASLVSTQGVEGRHHQLPVKGPTRQQPLGLFGVTGVHVLHEDLQETHDHIQTYETAPPGAGC